MTATAATPVLWEDRKRWLWLLGAPMMLLPLFSGLLVYWTGNGLFWWFAPAFVYIALPLLDWLVGEDRSNPPEWAVPQLERDRYYRYAVYLAVPLQYTTLIWGTWYVTSHDLLWWEWLALLISVGGVSGVSINTGHELGHKTDRFERWLAKIALAPTMYGHFFVEHNRGHHVRVATPEDPASSRYGESFWAFLPRTVVGSLVSAWRLEAARMRRLGLPVWHWRNDNLNAWAMSVVLFGGLTAWLGWEALPFLLLQAIYGFSLLEVVNYIEHYGLRREKLPSGQYERCQPQHSWNSNHVVTNLVLYQLQRHSDHHAYPTRSYQSLRHFDDLPSLPSGYTAMILVAYIPPLWFRMMNRRLLAHYGGDLRRANVKPSLRAALGLTAA